MTETTGVTPAPEDAAVPCTEGGEHRYITRFIRTIPEAVCRYCGQRP